MDNEINIPDIQYYSNSLPVGKGWLKERRGLEARTNFFSFKKVAETRCGLDSRIYSISYLFYSNNDGSRNICIIEEV
jgi:hypothetical protein